MQQRKLGSTGPLSAQIGLGLMGMSDLYGPADRGESLATIHAAWTPASPCSTPATSTAWATTNCCCATRWPAAAATRCW